MSDVWTHRPLRAPEAAILFHPDQRTAWAPSIVVHLHEPLDAALAADRLAALAAAHPIVRARLLGGRWEAGAAPPLEPLVDEPAFLRRRFTLESQPPVRVARSGDGRRLAITGHHAALDGRALVMVARALLGAAPVESVSGRVPVTPGSGTEAPAEPRTGGAREALRRLARPADRVAPSPGGSPLESFTAADAPAGAELRVAALAAAAVAAASDWNAGRGAPWSRIGLTIPVGGADVLGNVSTHRRLDLAPGDDVAAAVRAALARAVDPPDRALTPQRARLLALLAPVVWRLSDSLLVSNLGRVDLPGAAAVDFYPQARGRSAVAIGACTPLGGTPRLTVRARDLSARDARALLAALSAAL